jgi:hypothetical protein
MKTIAHSNIAKRFGAILAISLAGAVLAGSITPAAAHKHSGGGHHGHHGGKPSKPPQNPGPIGPLPRPQSQPLPTPVPQPPVVRDHRVPKPVVVRDHRIPAPVVVRDHRATPVVRDQRTRTTTVKVAGIKVYSGTTKGKRCVGGVCF